MVVTTTIWHLPLNMWVWFGDPISDATLEIVLYAWLIGHVLRVAGPLVATLRAVRRALMRRGAAIKRMHANRIHTSKTPVIALEEAQKYPGLIQMSVSGAYTIAPTLDNAISTAVTKLKAVRDAMRKRRDAQRAARAARVQRARALRVPPRGGGS